MSDEAKAFDCELGELVQLHRTACGLSTEDVASSLGVPPAQVERYEAGTNRLSVFRYWEMMSILNQEPASVLDQLRERLALADRSTSRADRSGADFMASNRGRKVISALAMCDNPNVLDALADLILAIGVHSRAADNLSGSSRRTPDMRNKKPNSG